MNGSDPVAAAVTATVSAAGTISALTINNGGSGYIGTSIQLKIGSPKQIGVGIGTRAVATATITNGIVTTPVSITNSGFGYDSSKPPQVIVEIAKPQFENITGITNIQGFSGIVTGISTVTGVGTSLAIKFDLSVKSPVSFVGTGLTAGVPIYIYDSIVGSAITSIDGSDSQIIGIGTTFFDNIYKIQSFVAAGATRASIICNILSSSNTSGINTFGYVQLA